MPEIYRLNSATVGVHEKNGKQIPVMAPEGAIVIVDETLDGARLIDCNCAGLKIKLYTVDIRERGTRVESSAKVSAGGFS